MKTDQLMPYREIIAVCSEIHINTMFGQNVEFLNVKPGGTYCLPLGFRGFSLYTYWDICHVWAFISVQPCVSEGLPTDRSPVQEALPHVYKQEKPHHFISLSMRFHLKN